MSAYREPPDGDFVAFIETLQRESAARIRLKGHAGVVGPASGSHGSAPSPLPAAGGAPEPVLNRNQAEELIARLTRSRQPAAMGKAAIGLAAGLIVLLYWVAAGRSLLPLLVGIGLLVWSISRLRGALRSVSLPNRGERARIEHLFGKKPSA